MRFFWTGSLKGYKPIRIGIFLFTIFIFLFWAGAFVHFGFKYGYSVEKVERYFFGESDFPFEISIAQIYEEAHISLFVFALLFLCVSALVIYSGIDERFKLGLILSLAILVILYSFSDYIVILLGRGYAVLKIFVFLLFQCLIFLSLVIIWFKRLENRKGNGASKFLAILIFSFALLNLVFVGLNFALFERKIGFSISNVVDYYLGNPERFMKPKSLSGLVEVSYFHFLAMALYLITLIHFVYIVSDRFNIALTIFLFVFAFIDNLGGILIVMFGRAFASVKLFSFFLFQFLLFLSSLILIYRLITLKFNFPNRGRI